MDSDFWAARFAAAKRQYALQQHNHSSHSDRFDGIELEEDVLSDFPCPYCYEDFDILSLCAHVEEEHPDESKITNMDLVEKLRPFIPLSNSRHCLLTRNKVCPVCSVKVSLDLLHHITHHHGHLIKMQRRLKLRRVAIPNSQALLLLGRELREAHLQVLLGGSSGLRSNNNSTPSAAAAVDPSLSSLIMNFHASDAAEEIPKSLSSSIEELSSKKTPPSRSWKMSNYDPHLSYEERERRMKQATGRAGFVQDLLLATLLGD